MSFRISFFLTLLLVIPACLFGQAFVSPKGVGSVSISYQNTFVSSHLFGKGETFLLRQGEPVTLLGQIRFQALFFDASYSITDKLAVSGYIPYIAGKFIDDSGQPPGQGFGNAHVITIPGPDGKPVRLPNGTLDPAYQIVTVDDGNYHGGFQDLGLRLRYNVAANPLYVTPFVEYNAPTHAYPAYGHAVYGNRVAEFKIGSYFGRTLDPVVPNMYVQGRYAFGFVQRILDVSRKRHHAEVEVGYFLTPSITVTAVLVGFTTRGGLDLPDDYPPADRNTTNPYWLNHIRVSRDNMLNWGIGFQYALNDRVTLYTGGVRTIGGRNMHATDYGVTFGFSWGFGGSPQRPCHC